MFISIRKAAGSLLVFAGIALLLGMAGADDVTVLSGTHTPLLPLMLKGLGFLLMMAIGAVLLGGGTDESGN